MAIPAFNHPWVDETFSPILIALADASPTTGAFEAYIERLDEWTRVTHDKYVWIIHPAKLSALQRKALAESQERRLPYMKQFQVGVAFVVNNPVIQTVLSAVFLFARPPIPYVVCANLQDAKRWALQKIK